MVKLIRNNPLVFLYFVDFQFLARQAAELSGGLKFLPQRNTKVFTKEHNAQICLKFLILFRFSIAANPFPSAANPYLGAEKPYLSDADEFLDKI